MTDRHRMRVAEEVARVVQVALETVDKEENERGKRARKKRV